MKFKKLKNWEKDEVMELNTKTRKEIKKNVKK